jgi:hypothetical protein
MQKLFWILISGAAIVSAAMCATVVTGAEVEMPDASQQYWITTVRNSTVTWDDMRLSSLMKQPSMRRLTESGHYNELDETSKFYRERIAPKYGACLPMIIVQRHDGSVVYVMCGEEIPHSAVQMERSIEDSLKFGGQVMGGLFRRVHPFKPCEGDECGPDGCPDPVIPPPAQPQNIVVQVQQPPAAEPVIEPESTMPWWPVVIAGVLGLLAVLVVVVMKERSRI